MAGGHLAWYDGTDSPATRPGELNDLARRLDQQELAAELHQAHISTPESSGSGMQVANARNDKNSNHA